MRLFFSFQILPIMSLCGAAHIVEIYFAINKIMKAVSLTEFSGLESLRAILLCLALTFWAGHPLLRTHLGFWGSFGLFICYFALLRMGIAKTLRSLAEGQREENLLLSAPQPKDSEFN